MVARAAASIEAFQPPLEIKSIVMCHGVLAAARLDADNIHFEGLEL